MTSQPPLPLTWFAPHDHVDGAGPHQHFEDNLHGQSHIGVPMVTFEPPDLASTVGPGQQELERLRAANKSMQFDINALGARPDMASVLFVRLEALKDVLLPDAAGQFQFELVFEQKMGEVLAEMLAQARQAKLTGGGPTGPGPGILLPSGVKR